MARPINTLPVPADDGSDPQLLEEVGLSAQQLVQIQSAQSDERDFINQLFGQVQMSRAISKFTDVVGLQKLLYIKETKAYRALAGKKGVDHEGNEITDVGTFDGFCRALGTSANKVNEDIQNLEAFGAEALAQLTSIGAGYRELRQYRKLPEDQKTALIEIAKAGDKEGFVELAEEIFTKHAKEKEALTKTLDETQLTLDARTRVLADKESTISTLQEQIAIAQRVASTDRSDALESLHDQVREISNLILSPLRSEFMRLADPALALGETLRRQALGAAIGRILAVTRTVAQDFDIPVSGPGAVEIDEDAQWDEIWAASLRDLDAGSIRLDAASGDGDVLPD